MLKKLGTFRTWHTATYRADAEFKAFIMNTVEEAFLKVGLHNKTDMRIKTQAIYFYSVEKIKWLFDL